ncbi:MAG: dihydrolipoamide acetyltransferase family protein [Anaerolineae bacterium]
MAETITMPKLGFDMREGVLVRWVKTEGEPIQKGEVLAEIETDKATVEVESSAVGVVRKLLANQGDVVPVGAPIAIIGAADEQIEAAAAPAPAPAPAVATTAPTSPAAVQTAPAPAPAPQAATSPAAGPVKASPLAKRIARERGIDLSQMQGTGPGGRIVRRDIEAALQTVDRGPQTLTSPSSVHRPSSAVSETVALTKLRQIIARRMSEAKQTVPHFYVTHEYKLDALMALRKQANDTLPDDEKLSVNDFIIKAVALALRQFPNLNASFAGDKIVHHAEINIGVAVAVENGLLTIVNKNSDQQSLRAISADIKHKVAAARQGKVRPEDIEGSTFSISNLGMYDVENFIAIINPPEAAILAVGSARQVPVVENGEIKIGWRMKATISVDHRVSDGAEAAQFMQKLAEFLENPIGMLI